MPNTLAHLGINGIAAKSILKSSDLKWIYLSAVIPDIPWIIQRIFKLLPGVDTLDLRLYVVIQAAFLFCIILSLAFAFLSKNFKKTLLILVFGSLLHLILDAFQIKWANGVHLFAPFSWKLMRFDFFWPESIPTYLITLFGLIYVIINWKSAASLPVDITFKSSKKILAFIIFLTVYFVVPVFLLNGPESENNHFVKTLRSPKRIGKYIEFDRASFVYKPEGSFLENFTNENFYLEGVNIKHDANISLKGKFISQNKILVKEYHIHSVLFRDASSYIGLFLVLTLWILPGIKRNNFE